MIYHVERLELLRGEFNRLHTKMKVAIEDGETFDEVKKIFNELKLISSELRKEVGAHLLSFDTNNNTSKPLTGR